MFPKILHVLMASLITSPNLVAQQQSVDSLAAAELSFAAMARATTIRQAFLHNLSKHSVVFERGVPVNGIEKWSQTKDDSALLIWSPSYALLSSSGDFGCTFGPSEYRPKPADTITRFFGHFISLWRRENEGWRVLCDMGVGNSPRHSCLGSLNKRTLKRARKSADTLNALNTAESFATKFWNKDPETQYLTTPETYFILPRKEPLTTKSLTDDDYSTYKNLRFEPLGHWFSKTNDLLFVYGVVRKEPSSGNYVQVWVKEKTWKLAVFASN